MKIKLNLSRQLPSIIGIREYLNSDGSANQKIVNIDLSNGQTKLARIQDIGILRPDGTLELTVCNDNGEFLPGVPVRIGDTWINFGDSAGIKPQTK